MRPSENALLYIGKTEKTGNSGFTDPVFEKEMKEEGWQEGWAWCSVLQKVIFRNCFPEKKELAKLFSPSTVKTYENFVAAGYKTSLIPKVDDLVIWQSYKNGKPQATGHAGVVVHTNPKDQGLFYSIEGNTIEAGHKGSDREGYIVAKKPRRVNLDAANGLRVLGFITIS